MRHERRAADIGAVHVLRLNTQIFRRRQGGHELRQRRDEQAVYLAYCNAGIFGCGTDGDRHLIQRRVAGVIPAWSRFCAHDGDTASNVLIHIMLFHLKRMRRCLIRRGNPESCSFKEPETPTTFRRFLGAVSLL